VILGSEVLRSVQAGVVGSVIGAAWLPLGRSENNVLSSLLRISRIAGSGALSVAGPRDRLASDERLELTMGLLCCVVWKRKRRAETQHERGGVVPVKITAEGFNVVLSEPPPADERVNVTGDTWRAVVGDEHHQPAAGIALAGIAAVGYDAVELKREPRNKFDSNAVAVIYRGKRIGYLSSVTAAQLQPSLKLLAKRKVPAICAIKADPSAGIMHVWVSRRG
jgi:hypothetical protein